MIWAERPGVLGWLTTVDHKRIALLYFFTTLAFFVAGGVEALLMRAQLAGPNGSVLSPEAYNQAMTMHGVTMIFLFVIPMTTGAFGNYLLPLLLGARDMAFPRLNALSYWLFLGSGLFLYSSVFMGEAPNCGWFCYTPLNTSTYDPGLNVDFYALGLIFSGLSTTAGALNIIVTTFRLRAPGMSLNRMPLMVFALLAVSFSLIFALPPLTTDLVFLELQRKLGFHFFDVANGGDPLLWQHLFWLFGHPEVYIIILPAMGIATSIIPTFSRRKMIAFPLVALAELLVAFIGFGVWAHHMFATGLSLGVLIFFAAASMMVVVPSTIQVYAWLFTVNLGRPQFRAPLLFIGGFIALFVIGGLSGIMFAAIPFDQATTDTYFVVAHFHFIIFGAAVFPILGGMFYWFPKVTGRMYHEGWAQASFWVTFLGTMLTFFPMHIVGLHGMTRRVYTYHEGFGWGAYNLAETIGAFILTAGLLMIFANLAWSRFRGAPAGPDPFHGGTLEWTTSSPPPPYNFAVIPTVRSAYPNWDRVEVDERRDVVLERPPPESGWPIALAAVIGLLFVALLTSHVIVAAILAVVAGLMLVAWHLKEQAHAHGWWGMLVFLATEITLFATLIGSYYDLRFRTPEWPPQGVPDPKLMAPLILLAVLVAVSAPVRAGSVLAQRGRTGAAQLAFVVAIALQTAYLAWQVHLFAVDLSNFSPRDSAYGSIYFTLLGTHHLHVLVGILLEGWLVLRLFRGVTRYRGVGVQATAFYWHVVNVLAVAVTLVQLSPSL